MLLKHIFIILFNSKSYHINLFVFLLRSCHPQNGHVCFFAQKTEKIQVTIAIRKFSVTPELELSDVCYLYHIDVAISTSLLMSYLEN